MAFNCCTNQTVEHDPRTLLSLTAVALTFCLLLALVLMSNVYYSKKSAFIVALWISDTVLILALMVVCVIRILFPADDRTPGSSGSWSPTAALWAWSFWSSSEYRLLGSSVEQTEQLCDNSWLLRRACYAYTTQLSAAVMAVIGGERLIAVSFPEVYFKHWTSKGAWMCIWIAAAYVACSASAAAVPALSIADCWKSYVAWYGVYNRVFGWFCGLVAMCGAWAAMLRTRTAIRLASRRQDVRPANAKTTISRKQWQLTKSTCVLATLNFLLVVVPGCLQFLLALRPVRDVSSSPGDQDDLDVRIDDIGGGGGGATSRMDAGQLLGMLLDVDDPFKQAFYLDCLLCLNVMARPLVYILFNADFQRAIGKTFRLNRLTPTVTTPVAMKPETKPKPGRWASGSTNFTSFSSSGVFGRSCQQNDSLGMHRMNFSDPVSRRDVP